MRIRPLVSLALVTLAACATTPREPAAPTPPAAPSAAPAETPEPPAGAAPSSSIAPPVASSAAVVPPAAPDEPRACPAGMTLVDGEYCTEVEHTCLREWYDKSNKKTICEEFAPKAKCVGKRMKKRFCIDDFAWPNQSGVRAEVMNNFYQAQVKCAAVDKRICTESEWTLACEGPEMKPFPYGWERDPTKCNGDQKWDGPDMKKVARRDPKELARLWRGVPNGAQPECKSDYGVQDLPGNTDDVVSNESWERGGMYSKFESVHTGGPWYKGTRNQCRPKIYTHDEGFYYYFLSFRCCAEPDGKSTDPRTPHQRKEAEPFSKVESLARFSAADVREKLDEKRRTGGCACKPKDTLCKTMCGTLLGPDAKDIDLKAPREREDPPPKKKRR
ncbi:MAG: hypothetical protein IT374_09965 [Polyangiaceae bacterium]|nr:hypothetical protein [Polyangiaceae bacterium]